MIDKHVPIPVELAAAEIKWKYQWRDCKEVGDSFTCPYDIDTVKAAAKTFCQRNKEFKFAAKVESVNPYKVRVWRIK